MRTGSLQTAFRLAGDSLLAHKLRSFLTLLGVIIGVSSVVLVGSAIEGLGIYAEQTTAKAFGTDSFLIAQLVQRGRLTRKEVAEKIKRNRPLKEDDLAYLQASTGDEVMYSPYAQTIVDVEVNGKTQEGCSLIGASATLPDIREVVIEDGRFFTGQEEERRAQVAIVGQDIKKNLFQNGNPIGSTIRVKGLDFTVIGVQEKLGGGFGGSQDSQVYVPFPVFRRITGRANGFSVFGRPKPETGLKLEEGLDVTRAALRSRSKTRPGEEDRFDTMTPESNREFIDRIVGLIAAVVVPVTAISLVVGGIVVMNIMLVSVTERTREIGVRKSLGARQSDIRLQFLVESALLASIGGLVGLILGWLVIQLAAFILQLPLTVPPFYVFLAIFVSASVGILSGWYPAARAARLDPVVALRAE
jgi:putative ABC transport system permease protein